MESRSFWLDTIPLHECKAARRAMSAQHQAWYPANIRATSDESSGHSPGNSPAVSAQLPGNISGNAGEYPRSDWHNNQKASGQLPLKSAQQFACRTQNRPRRLQRNKSRNVLAMLGQFSTKQTRRVREQSASTNSPRTQPGRGRERDADSPRPRIIRHLVEFSPCPQIVREPEQFTGVNHHHPHYVHRHDKSVTVNLPK